MTYQHQLTPWVVHKLLPNLKHLTITRFRRRPDAEAYLKVLNQSQPYAQFTITFDSGESNFAAQAES
ncbi:hypothetical protein H6F86_00580 [Phormidium sp. FACHB-592]|uniref:Uncharacterized protein n=1 Tax=Stenomitos frigidus AS-A4 TaxID=2933935 RepID=A0ABV0KMA4_9CYAN|nr:MULTISPECIES: hypothetical protein [Cyanophyceae]MBD2033993.1 hypothetical protein [Leptolyngbya sp. FACHB-321]MBD2072430.1 hypothetical protein [Phormidium sp. FACHB-592]